MVLLVGIVIHVDPLPPAKAYLATGQQGSSYHLLAEKFAPYFKQHRVELELIDTSGLSQGLKDLNDDDSRVNAGFLTAGAAELGQYPKMVSLGSLKYSPFGWSIGARHRMPPPPWVNMLKRRMAVGMEGTNTRMFLTRMLALHGQTLTPSPHTYEISHEEAATRFEKGELDAVFIVDGIDSPNVQRLLRVPDRHIVEFALAPAYLNKMPSLEMVTIPRGAIDMKDVFPPKDVSLLASTVTLVVESDTHPALQWLFLRAAESISQDRTEFFSKPNHFPEYVDRNVVDRT